MSVVDAVGVGMAWVNAVKREPKKGLTEKRKMSVKEQVVCESIERVQQEASEIQAVLNANPLVDIICLERDTIETAKAMGVGSEESLKVLRDASAERERLLKVYEKQRDALNLIDRLVELQRELGDLKIELYRIERKTI